MDIIISAAQGSGKTTLAIALIKQFLDEKSLRDAQGRFLNVEFVGDNASYLAQKFRDAKPEVILFDGCIGNATEMLTAVDAAKKYREQTGRPRTLAIYVVQEETQAVILCDVYRPKGKPLANEFKKPAFSGSTNEDRYIAPAAPDEANPRKTERILGDLLSKVLERATDAQSEAINAKLREVTGITEDTVIQTSDLSHDAKCEVHAFLLDMLRKQDEEA